MKEIIYPEDIAPMTEIYIIRHGQSKANEQDLFLGHGNMDLTELGYKQAEKTAAYLDRIHVDAIYSSDLLRAYNTALVTAKRKGLPVTTSKNLREIDAGKWEYMPFNEIIQVYEEDFLVWKHNIGLARCTGGESTIEVGQRLAAEIKRIAEENPGKTICIFSHAAAIRMLKAVCDGCAPEEMQKIPYASNASVSHLRYENGQLCVLEYSIDDFMGDLATRLPTNV